MRGGHAIVDGTRIGVHDVVVLNRSRPSSSSSSSVGDRGGSRGWTKDQEASGGKFARTTGKRPRTKDDDEDDDDWGLSIPFVESRQERSTVQTVALDNGAAFVF